MTDPFSLGGAGLPDPQINPTDPTPPAEYEAMAADASDTWLDVSWESLQVTAPGTLM